MKKEFSKLNNKLKLSDQSEVQLMDQIEYFRKLQKVATLVNAYLIPSFLFKAVEIFQLNGDFFNMVSFIISGSSLATSYFVRKISNKELEKLDYFKEINQIKDDILNDYINFNNTFNFSNVSSI